MMFVNVRVAKKIIMNKYIIFLLIGLCSFSYNSHSQRIELGKEVLEYLASDQLQGRAPGTEGDIMAREFLSKKFYKMWMGRFSFDYEQPFKIVTDIRISDETAVKIGSHSLILDVDYRPFIFGSEGKVDGPLLFVGQSIDEANLDMSGKVVLVYFGVADGKLPTHRNVINQVITARDKGAQAVIFVLQKDYGDGIEFFPFQYNRSVAHVGLPVVQISREFFHKLTAMQGVSASKVHRMKPTKINMLLNMPPVGLSVGYESIANETANVAGFIEGFKSNEWIVVGAHYDHLGFGGVGSGSRQPENHAVHNGADDNASGVAMVMMLAEHYKEHKPQSNMAFVLFGGEEQGLLGSKYFVDNLPFPVDKIKAMINFDMVGRLRDSTLGISGVKSADEFDTILSSWQGKPMTLNLGGDGLSGSDHAPFYSNGIPVLFFNTGLHADYHMPSDDIEYINYQGMQLIADLSVHLIDSLLQPETRLTYLKSKRSHGDGNHKTSLKVKLGIMPDVAGVVQNGLGVDGVKSGGPASAAGIQKGDVIIEIDGNQVTNIYDYMKRLSELKPDKTIVVKVQRNGEPLSVLVQL